MMNSSICIDANVIIWALTPALLSDKSAALLRDCQRDGVQLVAPALLAFEVTSVLRRLVYLGHLTMEEGEGAFERFQRISIRYSYRQAVVALAWQLAKEHNRPRAYDTAYLAVASLHDCPFWTGDRRLVNSVSQDVRAIRWIGDYGGGLQL